MAIFINQIQGLIVRHILQKLEYFVQSTEGTLSRKSFTLSDSREVPHLTNSPGITVVCPPINDGVVRFLMLTHPCNLAFSPP
jgi:hypothetical protein